MESIPFYHLERMFTVFFVEDLAFSEVRAILDLLLDEGVFEPESNGNGDTFEIQLEDASFRVWVNDFDVAIRKE